MRIIKVNVNLRFSLSLEVYFDPSFSQISNLFNILNLEPPIITIKKTIIQMLNFKIIIFKIGSTLIISLFPMRWPLTELHGLTKTSPDLPWTAQISSQSDPVLVDTHRSKRRSEVDLRHTIRNISKYQQLKNSENWN